MAQVRRSISYSFLHTLACPYQAFLRYEAALRGPTTPPLALGNAIHHALEKGHLNPDTLNLETLVKLFLDEHRRIVVDDDVFISYPQIRTNEAEGTDILGRYWKKVEKGYITKTPFAVEKEFKLDIAGTKIVGKIDKIEKTDEGYVVIDYKTGRKEPDEWFLRHNLQFTAYWWACKEIYGEYPVKAVWHHLRTNKFIETVRDEWDIEQLKRMVENAVKMQEQDIRHRIYHEQICNWCDFKGATCDDQNLEQEILAKRSLPVINTGPSIQKDAT
jgi:CRISPR/Cas system-associated exonuclease Cas4 (RecB family)